MACRLTVPASILVVFLLARALMKRKPTRFISVLSPRETYHLALEHLNGYIDFQTPLLIDVVVDTPTSIAAVRFTAYFD